MSKFFISYSRADGADMASNLRRDISLLDYKHQVFRDLDDISAGEDWLQALQFNISECDYFILLLTEASLSSEYVKKEIELVIQSELATGSRKLFIYQIGSFAIPEFIPARFQIQKQTSNYTIDFYKLLSSILKNPSFFTAKNEVRVCSGGGYDVSIVIESDKYYFDLIDSVEYRFDHEYFQAKLNLAKVILKKNKRNNFKIEFWTSEPVTVFIVIYLTNSKQVNLINKVQIG